MENVVIILILVVIVAVGVKESIKHFRGEGGCCGGSSTKPQKKKLKNKVVNTYILHIDGMHCQGCVNTVTRVINDFDGAAARVSLGKKLARVSCDREVDIEAIKAAIIKKGYSVR